MQLEDFFDFLAPNDIRIKGHRIGIESVLYEYIHRKQTAEEIAERFPSLALKEIYATILYYLQNRAEVSAYLTEWINHEDRMVAEQQHNPSAAVLRLRQLKAERELQRATKQAKPKGVPRPVSPQRTKILEPAIA